MSVSLLSETKSRFVLFPIQSQPIWIKYKQAINCFWKAEEINLTRDYKDWERLTEDEMLEAFSKSTRKEYVDKQEHEDMVSELVMAGYCVFKPEMSTQADKLKEYAETYIFPYYNQQQVSILF